MRRTREESADTRRAPIAAATQEFAERGCQGASLRSICAAAHVTTGALYFLFAGKGELFERSAPPSTRSRCPCALTTGASRPASR